MKIWKILNYLIIFFSTITTIHTKQIFANDQKTIFHNTENGYLLKKEEIQTNRYLLGPGDKIKLIFFNFTELSGDFEILNDGTIQMPYIGSININNLTFEQATNKLRNLLRAELINPDFQLKLIEKRPLKISLIGEIERPGLYSLSQSENSKTKGGPTLQISGMPTVIDAIQKAGGITQEANLFNVEISRRLPGNNNEYKSTEVNLMKLILDGDQSQNLYLFDGDIIKITKAKYVSENLLEITSANFSPKVIKIYVIGEVEEPGPIEVSANTLLNQGLLYAGGPKNWRSNKGNVKLIRINRNGTVTRKVIKFNLAKGLSSDNNPPLKDGDTIVVSRNLLAKGTDSLNNITKPISDVVTTWTLFKLIGQ